MYGGGLWRPREKATLELRLGHEKECTGNSGGLCTWRDTDSANKCPESPPCLPGGSEEGVRMEGKRAWQIEKRSSLLGPAHQPPPGESGCQGRLSPAPQATRLLAAEQPLSRASHPLSGSASTAQPGCQGDGPTRRRRRPERLSPPPTGQAC